MCSYHCSLTAFLQWTKAKR